MKRNDIVMTPYLQKFLSFDLGRMDENACPKRAAEIEYTPGLKADLYLPENSGGRLPLIIVVFGGGWISGFKRDKFIQPMLKPVRHGYAVAVPDYTLGLDAAFPQALVDIKQCTAYFIRHAEEYGIDCSRITLWGESAGGHLALEAGLVKNSEVGVKGEDRICSVIAMYPLTDPLTAGEQAKAEHLPEDNAGPDSVFAVFMGKGYDSEAMMKLASPVCHLRAGMPKIILQHGTADQMVPYHQSVEFKDMADAAGWKDKVVLELAAGRQHTDPWFFTDENIAHLMEMIG